jgi:hypothetical protein
MSKYISEKHPDIFPKISSELCTEIKKEVNNKIFDFNIKPILKYSEDIVIMNGPNIYNLDNQTEKIIYNKFQFSPFITEKANLFIQDLISSSKNQPTIIGIHYRHGNGEFKGKMTCYDKYFHELDKLLEEINDHIIILSTDCKQVIDIFKVKYPQIQYYSKNFREHNYGPLHKNILSIEEIDDAFIEMNILANVHILICNHSSFNWYGQYVNDKKIIHIK